MNPLMQYATGQVVPTRDQRPAATRARATYNTVRQAGLNVDGAFALAAHIMEGLVELDDQRRILTNGDPVFGAELGGIEMVALKQAKLIQAGLFSDWRL